MVVRPHGIARLPLDRFWWNLIFWAFFSQTCRKNLTLIKTDKNNGYFTWRRFHIYARSRWILHRMRNFSNKSCRENQNTHFYVQILFFFSENLAVCEIISKNMEEPERLQMTVQYGACALHPGKPRLHAHAHALGHTHALKLSFSRVHTHTEICNNYCFSTVTVVSRTRFSFTLYAHCLFCFYWSRLQSKYSHILSCLVRNSPRRRTLLCLCSRSGCIHCI